MKKTKLFEFGTDNGRKYTLTQREKAFCELYSSYGVSGADAVLEAGYKPKNRQTAYVIASENLRKPKILAYIKQLYTEYNFSDEEIMREHLFLIKQHADLSTKARAIDMYYKKKGYYKEPEQISPSYRSYEDMTDEEVQAKLDEYFERELKERGLKTVPIRNY